MTTLVYCNRTKLLAADTRVTIGSNYSGYGSKILFPKKNVIVASAGDGGQGEWLRFKLQKMTNIHEFYGMTDKPKLDEFSAFVWWNGPYIIQGDLYPFPIEMDYWRDGTGGDFALAFLAMGMDIQEAVVRASRLDINSSAPVHVVKCDSPDKKVSVYPDTIVPPTNYMVQRHTFKLT